MDRLQPKSMAPVEADAIRRRQTVHSADLPAGEYDHPEVTAQIGGHPIHAALVHFPIVCFILALGTDIAYWQTGNLMWVNFSAWLLFVGVVGGVLAGLFGMIDLFNSRAIRARGPAWPHAIGNVVVLGLALVNNFVHARDGWPAVVPLGLILSALTVALMLVTVWLGRELVLRHGVGVSR